MEKESNHSVMMPLAGQRLQDDLICLLLLRTYIIKLETFAKTLRLNKCDSTFCCPLLKTMISFFVVDQHFIFP